MGRHKIPERPNPLGDCNFVTAVELAQFLGVSPKHVRRLAEQGAIPKPVRLGRIYRWNKRDIEAFVSR